MTAATPTTSADAMHLKEVPSVAALRRALPYEILDLPSLQDADWLHGVSHGADTVQCVISYVSKSMDRIYVQPAHVADHLNRLQLLLNYYMTDLKQTIPNHPLSLLTPVREQTTLSEMQLALMMMTSCRPAPAAPDFDQPDLDKHRWCVVLHSNKNFYRAKILRRVSPVNFEVRFIDYGDTMFVPSSQLYVLHEQFKTLPPCAHACSVPDNVLVNDKDRAAIWWRDQLEGLLVDVKFGNILETSANGHNDFDSSPVFEASFTQNGKNVIDLLLAGSTEQT